MMKEKEVRLSRHFTLWEMTRSGTALREHILNTPSAQQVEFLRALCEHVLEPLRSRYGAITVTSGYRCPQLNKAVGGVPTSQHMRGEAADIFIPNLEIGRKYFDFIKNNTTFDQLIWEPRGADVPRWLHVSYTTRRPNRMQVLY